MINILRVAGLLMAVSSASLIAADYIITINGISKEIDLDQNVMLELSDGTPLKLTLNQNEYLRFKGDLFSFEHASKYRANRTGLDDGIFQTTLFTPLGPLGWHRRRQKHAVVTLPSMIRCAAGRNSSRLPSRPADRGHLAPWPWRSLPPQIARTRVFALRRVSRAVHRRVAPAAASRAV